MDTLVGSDNHKLPFADWRLAAFCSGAYLAIRWAFLSNIGTSVYIGLPFRRMYIPILGWSILCLYGALHSLIFRSDLKANLRKMVFLGVTLHLAALLFYLNLQIAGSAYLSKMYHIYIDAVTIASLTIISVSGYFLRRDTFLSVPLIILSAHLVILYLMNGFIVCVATAAIISLLSIIISGSCHISKFLYAVGVSFFKDERRLVAALFLIAVISRLLFAMQILRMTGGGSAFVDASDDGRTYNANAWTMVISPEKILQGGSLFPGIWDPGYIFFLALIYKFAGHNFYAVTFVQGMLGGALSVLSYYIARQLFDNRSISVLTSMLVIVSQLLIMYSIVLGAEALSIPLLAAFVLLSIHCFKQPGNILYRMAAGVVLGLLCVTRSLFMALPLFMFAAELFAVNAIALGRKIRNSLITVLVACLLIAPVTLINYMNDGKFNLIVQSGARLSSCWVAAVSPWPDISPDNRALVEMGINPFNDLAGALRITAKNPEVVAGRAFHIYLKRLQNYFVWPCFGFFDPILLLNNSRIPNHFASSMEFYSYLIFFIGLCHLSTLALRQKAIFVIFAIMLYSIMAHCFIITIVTVRYRTPIVPYLMMVGAIGLYELYRFSRKGFPGGSI